MNDGDKTYLLKELTRTIDESDSTAAFCLCQRWILKDAFVMLKEQEDLGAELTNAVELIHKKNERIKKLLKEQEPKNVIESENMYNGLPITHCPTCGVSLDRYLYGRQHEGQINNCPFCGQKVKWE